MLVITPKHMAYFRRNISKDERTLLEQDTHVGNVFIKQACTPELAKLEYDVLALLHRSGLLVPTPLVLREKRLELELAKGIRLYDLFRMLAEIASEHPGYRRQCLMIRRTLLAKSVRQLKVIQPALEKFASRLEGYSHYSFELQIQQLLLLLIELSGQVVKPQLITELIELGCFWHKHCCLVPFRDATPKNILVLLPEFSSADFSNRQRKDLLLHKIKVSKIADWQQVNLLNYDFTSAKDLTAPEDDVISLLAHASSFVPQVMYPQHLVLSSAYKVDPKRAALALLVRYVRFGGRKLAYRLINPLGFSVRFRFDSPTFYFVSLPSLLEQLCPGFSGSYPTVIEALNDLANFSAEMMSLPIADTIAEDPYLLEVGQAVTYWQESPLEYVFRR